MDQHLAFSASSPRPLPNDFALGELVAGKYLLERQIGEGGLCLVYAARHVELEQTVAIKCLRNDWQHESSVVERFLREARLASKIKSENVVRIFDVDRTESGAPFMVMEYLEGIDLRRKLDSGPLSTSAAIDYVLQACDALAEAHVSGIVHRDLKPENLFLARRAAGAEIVKVLDFGISKSSPTSTVTLGGELFGTPVYMSPEHLRSAADVDQRSDIWSLGVVLFELLTGNTPFRGDSIPQLCVSVLHDPLPSLASLRPDAPSELQAILERCLAKAAADRYPNVGQLAGALAMFAPARSVPRIEQIVSVLREAGQDVATEHELSGVLEIVSATTTTTLTSATEITLDEIPRTTATTKRRRRAAALGALLLLLVSVGAVALYQARQARRREPALVSSRPLEALPSVGVEAPPSVVSATVAPPPNEHVPVGPVLAQPTTTSHRSDVRPVRAPATSTIAPSPSASASASARGEVSSPAPTVPPTKRRFRTEF